MKTATVATLLLAAASFVTGAQAQMPKCSPARLVVPYPPGGPTDAMGRALAEHLGKRLQQTVIVENKPGASSAIGTAAVAKAAPDGCTWGLVSIQLALNPILVPKLPYDTDREIAPVALVATFPSILVAHPDFAPKTVQEAMSFAAREPGSVGVATTGLLGTSHLMIEQLNKIQGGPPALLHMPYKGSSAAHLDVLAGRVPLMFDSGPAINEYIRTGRVKALAVSGARREASMPDVPTLAEAGYPQVQAVTWLGLITTGGTPAAAITALNAEVDAVLKMPDMKERLARIAYTPEGGSAERFASFIKAENKRWGSLIKDLNLKLD